ncbi:hypothetical protein ACOSP7_022147 [Xanthoceras sorbifolium]
MVRLRSEQFPPRSYSKLHARRTGPFQVVKKIGPNAYVINLPYEYTINPIFNVEDLTEFKGECVSPALDLDTTIRVLDVPKQLDTVVAIRDHQFISTRRRGYYKFLVQWAHKPISESVWLQGDEVSRLNPSLYQAYLGQYLPEASSLEGGKLMQLMHCRVSI